MYYLQTLPVDTTLPVTELAAERGGSFEVDEVHEKERDCIERMIAHCKATDAWYRNGAQKGQFGNPLALGNCIIYLCLQALQLHFM